MNHHPRPNVIPTLRRSEPATMVRGRPTSPPTTPPPYQKTQALPAGGLSHGTGQISRRPLHSLERPRGKACVNGTARCPYHGLVSRTIGGRKRTVPGRARRMTQRPLVLRSSRDSLLTPCTSISPLTASRTHWHRMLPRVGTPPGQLGLQTSQAGDSVPEMSSWNRRRRQVSIMTTMRNSTHGPEGGRESEHT